MATSPARWSSGARCRLEPEPQKNGKTIRWCRVDVGPEHNDAEGSLARDRLRCAQLRGRRPRRGRAARCGAAGRLRHRRPQDVRPRLRRDDLLGQASSGWATTTTASWCWPTTDLTPGRTRTRCSTCATRCSTSPSPPTAATACRCAVWPGRRRTALDVAFTDPVDRPVPAAVADGYPVELESAACPLFVAVGVTGIDPTRPSPRWLPASRPAGRHAADLAGRRHHQLRDARDRAADPRLRRRPAAGPDRRPAGRRRARS